MLIPVVLIIHIFEVRSLINRKGILSTRKTYIYYCYRVLIAKIEGSIPHSIVIVLEQKLVHILISANH